jgi:hypothetical protein
MRNRPAGMLLRVPAGFSFLRVPHEIFQIKVTLSDSDPVIWRRLLVPANMTLHALHIALQAAMGWDGSHMHTFRKGKQFYGIPNAGERFLNVPRTIDDHKVRLDEVLPRRGSDFVYTYDMGDSWEHAIVLEKRLPVDSNLKYPACLGGERACPPEDCGGIYMFQQLLEAYRHPEHERHAEILEWVGEDWVPDAFSLDRVNQRLRGRRRRRIR